MSPRLSVVNFVPDRRKTLTASIEAPLLGHSTPAPRVIVSKRCSLLMDGKLLSLMKWLKCIIASGKSCCRFFNPEADGDSLNRCPYMKDAKSKNRRSGCPPLPG